VNFRVLSFAERVIIISDRDYPADSVLRQELKAQNDLSRDEMAEVSRSVFSYFRWRGWMKGQEPLRDQIVYALELAERFAKQPGSFADAELVARSVPSWIQSEMEITPAFARTLQTEPRLWLRARPGQGKFLAQRFPDSTIFGAGPLSDTLEYHGPEDLFRTAEFHAGDFELQDLNSQAVGWLCAPAPGETWWDACAGEGGKMLHLSDLMANKGLIWASDRAEWRLRKLKRRAARAKVFNFRAALWVGGTKLPTKTKFDGVLVDAPCSGIGTWQRNPHARWTLRAEDVRELAELQAQLLENAAISVKPGGKLVYSVCSPARSETTRVVEGFESTSLGFSPLPVKNPLAPDDLPGATVLLYPQVAGGNGMFIAAWVRGG
jgi:16S rRNA (cytosine967-C5)-methyltransferase